MKQAVATKINDAIHDYRDGESILLIESPFESAEIAKVINSKHIGLRVTVAVRKRTAKLRTVLDKIFKALDTVAFDDEKNIDYFEVVRVRADDIKEECQAVEIIEITQKRNPWINK